MICYNQSKRNFIYRSIVVFIVGIFVSTSILPYSVSAQTNSLNLPVPGTMITSSSVYYPVLVKGIEIHPENPLMFDFIMDTGDTQFTDEEFREESAKLAKYFLAALTVPEEENVGQPFSL